MTTITPDFVRTTPPCMTVVTPEFIRAAVELADALKTLASYDKADDLSTMPREYWNEWIRAANVIQNYGNQRQEDDAQG